VKLFIRPKPFSVQRESEDSVPRSSLSLFDSRIAMLAIISEVSEGQAEKSAIITLLHCDK
jgi:hypothetical protein